jgi:uncharacterized membrane protein
MNASHGRGKPFDVSGKRSADIAYMCYLFIAATIAMAEVLAFAYHSPRSSERFAEFQTLGMVVVLPLVVLSLLAALVGLLMSLTALAYRPLEWGLAVLPVLVAALLIALTGAEDQASVSAVPKYFEAAFVVCALWFAIVWFGRRRGRT